MVVLGEMLQLPPVFFYVMPQAVVVLLFCAPGHIAGTSVFSVLYVCVCVCVFSFFALSSSLRPHTRTAAAAAVAHCG